jgi:hypothetical protein
MYCLRNLLFHFSPIISMHLESGKIEFIVRKCACHVEFIMYVSGQRDPICPGANK